MAKDLQIKFTYFPLESMADELRIAMKMIGVEFEDERIPFDQWPELKPKTPAGHLPTLTVNGTVYHEFPAIKAMIESLAGDKLVEQDPVERLKSEQAYSLSTAIRRTIYLATRASGDERTPARVKAVADVKPYIARLEDLAAEHGGYFTAQKRVALPELSVSSLMRWIGSGIVDDVPADLFAGCPHLQKVREHVAANEVVRAHRELHGKDVL